MDYFTALVTNEGMLYDEDKMNKKEREAWIQRVKRFNQEVIGYFTFENEADYKKLVNSYYKAY